MRIQDEKKAGLRRRSSKEANSSLDRALRELRKPPAEEPEIDPEEGDTEAEEGVAEPSAEAFYPNEPNDPAEPILSQEEDETSDVSTDVVPEPISGPRCEALRRSAARSWSPGLSRSLSDATA